MSKNSEAKFPYKISKNGSPQQFRFCSTSFTTIGDNFIYFETLHIAADVQAQYYLFFYLFDFAIISELWTGIE